MNKKDFMNKKGGMSVSVVLLVVFTMIIIGIIVGTFILNEKKLTYHYKVPSEIDYLNNEVMELDFYLNDIFYKAVSKRYSDADEIISNYKEILDEYNAVFLLKYKAKIVEQLNSDNVLIEDDKVSFHVKLVISRMQEDNVINMRYDYERTFVVRFMDE